MASGVVDGSVVRAETPPPRRRQSAGASPKASGSGSNDWTRSPPARPRHLTASFSEGAGDFSAPKPRRVSDEEFLSPVPSRTSPFEQLSSEDLVLSPDRPCGKENSTLSPSSMHAPPRQPRTPGQLTPMPSVREHGGIERSPKLSEWTPAMNPTPMNPIEAWEHALMRSPAPPGLPQPSVRNTFLTFDSPLRMDRPQSPPKSVPANHLFGSVESDWLGLASPPPALPAAPPAWPPSTPEPQLRQGQNSLLTPDVAALPLRLSDFLPALPAVPSMQSFANASTAPPSIDSQPASTAGSMPMPLVTSGKASFPECPATPSCDAALVVPAGDAAEQGGDCSQVAVTCAEAVMTSEELDAEEQSDAAWSHSWAQMVPPTQSQALCYTDQFQPQPMLSAQAFNVETLSAQSQSSHAQFEIPHQFVQHIHFVPQQDQHQHMTCPMQHDVSQPMQNMLQGQEQQPMHQQHFPQQQMPHQLQQVQGSLELQTSSQLPMQIPQLIQQQMHDPMQQLACDHMQQMQQLQHVQQQVQQMQQQEMQHQVEQYMHQQIEQQMQQHVQRQQLQEQTQQMINMLHHQLSQAQPPPSHSAAAPRAQVKLSELLELPAGPPAAASGDSALGAPGGGSGGGPAGGSPVAEDAPAMSAEAPAIAEKWADELVVPPPCDAAPAGVSILDEVLREIGEPESASGPASERNRGPRSGGRR